MNEKLRQDDIKMKYNAYLCTCKMSRLMAQVSMTVRMDSQLKQMFDSLCREFGMSVNTAINIFANAVVKTRSIPFRIGSPQNEFEDETLKSFWDFKAKMAADNRPELTLEEINEEIRLAREERAAREKEVV